MAIPIDGSAPLSRGVRNPARRAPAARRPARRLAAAAGALGLALCLTACGSSTSSSSRSYTGPKKGVAEAISNFQSDATSLDSTKICEELLAEPTLKRLEAKGGNCSKSIKAQLEEVDTFTVTVESISLKGSTATAKVKSTVYGKEKAGTISLAKEKGRWRISDLS